MADLQGLLEQRVNKVLQDTLDQEAKPLTQAQQDTQGQEAQME
jgi:hypothetical protein